MSDVDLMALETETQGCMGAAKGPAVLLKENHADYYLTTTTKIPGDIALQCLRGFSVILRKSVQNQQNRWPATVSHLIA